MFGPIIPQVGACTCPGSAPNWGCLLQVLQQVINVGVAVAIVIIVLLIAYAGFRFMTAGANADARLKARNLVTNALVGLGIILTAWLIVDFVMKTVYDQYTTYGRQEFGPWNEILAPTGDDMCLMVRTPEPIASGTVSIIFGRKTTSLGGSGVLCPEGNPGCSVNALMAAGLTESQARAMSCIAMTESSGDPNQVNSSSRACGLFQITNASSRGNWRQPEHHQPPCSTSTSCTNARCNMQTAVIMFKKYGYQPWTCAGCNAKAQACVNRYDPGT